MRRNILCISLISTVAISKAAKFPGSKFARSISSQESPSPPGFIDKMYGAFGQFASTTQFYLFGRSHCTRTGWENAHKSYPKPDLLDSKDLDLSGKVFMITGANAGIGREITTFVASKGATVYMVCRNPQRANTARDAIVAQTKNEKVHLLLGDCGLESDIRRMWEEFKEHQHQHPTSSSSSGAGVKSAGTGEGAAQEARGVDGVKLDCLVCNAGALMNEKTFTAEGVEVTFATHLLFGTYLLGSLALPIMQATADSRLIVVSSGGMYNTKFPAWDVATSTGNAKYDGQFAYAYAKRAQVLLCEEWAQMYKDKVTVVSAHPGWTQTEAVDAAYGDAKRFLEPLRTPWQGAEGIVWLSVAPTSIIQSGAFYLDRKPQVKHMAGPFFSEGGFTKNTPAEVSEMMEKLQAWSSGRRPSLDESAAEAARNRPLGALAQPIKIEDFMGDWNVLANIPTYFEVCASNCVEKYQWNSEKQVVEIAFEYFPQNAKAMSAASMRATMKNAPVNTHWALSPKIGVYLPLNLDYLLIDFEEDYSIVSVPDRKYVWIMIRDTPAQFLKERALVLDEYELKQKRATDTTSSSGAAAGASAGGKGEGVGQKEEEKRSEEEAAKWEKERAILQRAVLKLDKLGIDVSKIERVIWKTAGGSK